VRLYWTHERGNTHLIGSRRVCPPLPRQSRCETKKNGSRTYVMCRRRIAPRKRKRQRDTIFLIDAVFSGFHSRAGHCANIRTIIRCSP
jgi:hypothetical protein